MRKAFLLLLLIEIGYKSTSQSLYFGLRLPLQYEQQKAIIPFSWGNEIQNANAVNFGVDALLGYDFKKFSPYAGVGFFRSRINIKRFNDHQSLNAGRDSLPIGKKPTIIRIQFLDFRWV